MKKIFTVFLILASVFMISCENKTPEPRYFNVKLVSDSDVREYKIAEGDAFIFPKLANKADGSVARAVLSDNGICYFPGDKVVITEDVVFEVIWTDYTYEINDEGILVSVKGTSSDLVIPHVVGEKEIKGLSTYFLKDNNSVKDVYIQEGVSSIGAFAFEYSNVINITLPSTVTVGIGAFQSESIMKLKTTCPLNSDWNSDWNKGFDGMVISSETFVDTSGNRYAKTLDYEGNEVLVLVEVSADSSDFTVPGSVNGKRVWGIANDVFADNKTFSNLVVPEGIEYIGHRAFHKSEIATISLPESLKTIGRSSFSSMANITELTLPDGIKVIPENALSYNTNLKTVDLPADLESVGAYAFSGSTKISKLILPAGLSLHSYGIFQFWTSNQTLSFASKSDMLLSDGNWNANCGALLEFRDDFTTEDGFTYTHLDDGNLMLVDIPEMTANITIKSKVLDPNTGNEVLVKEIGNAIFKGNQDIKTVAIDEGFTKIGKSLFRGCTNLDSVTLPTSLLEIPDEAFYGCTNLKTIDIPAAVETIGTRAFAQCGFESVDIPASVQIIGIGVFQECESLATVVFEEGSAITSIPESAFEDCYLLTSVKWPVGLQEIGVNAFAFTGTHCNVDYELTIPASVTVIGDSAFKKCQKMSGIVFAEGSELQLIGNSAFDSCLKLKNISFPEGLVTIGNDALNSCNALESIRIPSTIKSMGAWACYFYPDASEVVITLASGCNETGWPENWYNSGSGKIKISREPAKTNP